jgi:hypothetical protein
LTLRGIRLSELAIPALALVGAGALAFYVMQHFVFSYRGLSSEQVRKVYDELDSRYAILSRVQGRTWDGGMFYRGIYTSKDGSGYPLYYRFEEHPGGDTSLDLYPLIMEKWTTGADFLGQTGRAIFPE